MCELDRQQSLIEAKLQWLEGDCRVMHEGVLDVVGNLIQHCKGLHRHAHGF
jgi:hypothetical protein